MRTKLKQARLLHLLIFGLFLAGFTELLGFAFSQNNPEDITGIWMTASKESMVQVFKQNNKFYGRLYWLKIPIDPETGKPKLDKKNPDPKLRTRPILGLQLVNDFEYNAKDKVWENGTIYDPKSGSTYNCKATLSDHNTMNVRGYIGYSWMGLGRTEIWKKISN